MSQQHESDSNNGSHVGDSRSKEAMNYRWDLDPLYESDPEGVQHRKIRGSFFRTYTWLIWLWIIVVCACLGAEAFVSFKYGKELFSDHLLKWLAGPISVGLFGGALVLPLLRREGPRGGERTG